MSIYYVYLSSASFMFTFGTFSGVLQETHGSVKYAHEMYQKKVIFQYCPALSRLSASCGLWIVSIWEKINTLGPKQNGGLVYWCIYTSLNLNELIML